jgi:hypothetical protein
MARKLTDSGSDSLSQTGHRRRAIVIQIWHCNVGRTERNPPIRGQAVMGDAAMPLAGVSP